MRCFVGAVCAAVVLALPAVAQEGPKPETEGVHEHDRGGSNRADWAFDRLDQDGDGSITRKEFRAGMEMAREHRRDRRAGEGRGGEHREGGWEKNRRDSMPEHGPHHDSQPRPPVLPVDEDDR